MNDQPVNLLALDRAAMEQFFVEMGEKRFRAAQVVKWIHQFGVDDFEAMTNLGKALRTRLAEETEVRAPNVLTDQLATDGTRKWLMEVGGGNSIETVYIPEPDRGTLCISSQVGCSLNCAFCATAQQGFNRNLTAGEIIGQVWQANQLLGGFPKQHVVTNVVLMGMGEPLLNLDAVMPALRLMLDNNAYNLSRRRVTLSTAGVVPGIDRLRETGCDVSLAVSLHAPHDALRDELVPLNRKYPLAELMAACKRYVASHPHRRVTFEYVMLDGVNDSESHAYALAELLADVPAKVNLIPFNPFRGAGYERSPQAVIDRFREILIESGLVTVTRRTRGDDIDAACGQLVGRVADRTRRQRRYLESIGMAS